jgi:S-adenosylmethionine hydrolase
MKQPIITLMTDFGMEDGYVASMKGVVLTICPEARLVDISHLIPPQDVRAGAFLLSRVYRYFPEATIHLAVVDPGVGTERKALAIETGGHFFIGPDNGLFTWVLKGGSIPRVISMENPAYRRSEVSSTFHGRDIFAPAAAYLAKGEPLSSFGSPCVPWQAAWGSIIKTREALLGEVIYIDHFGNLITNIGRSDLESLAPAGERVIMVGNLPVTRVVNTYGEAEPQSTVALIGSSDNLEIALALGSAAAKLGIEVGTPVSVGRRHAETAGGS